jgi:thiamine biosynthesis lipoprotein
LVDEYLGKIKFEQKGSLILGYFRAMANPCVFIIEHQDVKEVQTAMYKMAEEAWRIEQKYSRYLSGSVLGKINSANGKTTPIDAETYHLLQLSNVLWQESQGMFDISSGVFRKIWTFKDQHKIPSQSQVNKLLKQVGWRHIKYDEQQITLPVGMQIDFGGIGKEYAADRCASLVPEILGTSVLVNLGGDVVTHGSRADKTPWEIGIETKTGGGKVWKKIPLSKGAIATSGDVYKSVLYKGKRYGHIINALTGYPVTDSPSTVTVAAPNCTEAGMLSTLAMLHGKDAENFLEERGRPFWTQR